jgi:hypothetical protein
LVFRPPKASVIGLQKVVQQLFGSRPGLLAYVHFRAINWRCHRNKVSGVAIGGYFT